MSVSSLKAMKLSLTMFLVIGLCNANKCSEKIDRHLNKIDKYTYSEAKATNQKVKLMMSAEANCKIAQMVRVILLDDLEVCKEHRIMLLQARNKTNDLEDLWCSLRGSLK